ncbi:WD40-repeat-containing domain protein [Aspergillus avenaceus]|uniref:WD40-repeat-containing domain protein n=1 Tax=Aspergillus avenaceus TaxID=36643 RepID=A0A5N6TNJ6_ASPAV|nr:WD40-repeat-containing domain protein [Aspergillus avenaceus]
MTHDMSQLPRQAMGRDAGPRASPRQCASNHAQIGSDDPSLVAEAKSLLSQFMRHPSHSTQGFQNGKSAVSQNASHVRDNDASRSDDGRQVTYVISDDSAPESVPGTYGVSAKGQTTACLPHTRRPRTTTVSQTSHTSEGYRAESDPVLPVTESQHSNFVKDNQSRPTVYKSSPSNDNRSARDDYKAAGTRRSARSRTGPANYYERFKLFNLDSEEELSDSNSVAEVANTDQQEHHDDHDYLSETPPGYRKQNSQGAIIYFSPEVQILKMPFETLSDVNNLERASYCPERNPANYRRRLKAGVWTADRILHVDFDQKETTALLNLLLFTGCQWTYAPETALADQLIQELASFLQGGLGDASVVWSVKEVIQSGQDRKQIRRAKHLVTKLLYHQKRRHFGSYFTTSDCQHADDDIYRLSAYLPFASALKHRQYADIEAFIADAKKGCLPSVPSIIKAIKSDDSCSASRNTFPVSSNLNKLLRERALGYRVNQQISSDMLSGLKLSKTWKGASNDVIVLAWSSDGTKFAAGAAAQCDEDYNQGNNLVLGDLAENTLIELPDHWIRRSSGRSRGTMDDHRLFMSVTACQWFGDTIYTASYDNTVKLWKPQKDGASCYKTLRHDSKVQVMAKSTYIDNLLATGTHSIGIWDIQESRYSALDFPRQRSKRDIALLPTSLAWGHLGITKEILVAGMSEKGDDVPLNGLLAAWRLNESSVTPLQLSPSSQNIFDIKWHPSLPSFATASSTRGGGTTLLSSKDTRSVVRLYSPFTSKRCTIEFECPALDINDVTFCPNNPNYVTASCTDGVTYVWDHRNPDSILHKLVHGRPLNQIDETIAREQADVGVRAALWGDSVNRFYTGASDGVLRSWNILQSSDDVHIQDVAFIQEEIMCGAFSEDKSNLLIGDAAGGLHLLSSGPYTDGLTSFGFRPASRTTTGDNGSDCESGIEAARRAILNGHLTRHPIYGVGQGPRYNGPYAAWARPEGTPGEKLSQTKLKDEWQLRQLDGVPPVFRNGLDKQSQREVESQRHVARIRNKQVNKFKRKRIEIDDPDEQSSVIDLCSDDGGLGFPGASDKPKRPMTIVMGTGATEVIDLTADSGSESSSTEVTGPLLKASKTHFSKSGGGGEPEELKETLEDDFWWPPSGQVDANI